MVIGRRVSPLSARTSCTEMQSNYQLITLNRVTHKHIIETLLNYPQATRFSSLIFHGFPV